MNIFLLEDDYARVSWFKMKTIGHVLTVVSTVEDAKQALAEKEYRLLLLDHDLGGTQMAPSDSNSGYAVAEFIRDRDIPGEVIIHSCNPIGAKRMQDAIGRGTLVPFPHLKKYLVLKEEGEDEDG